MKNRLLSTILLMAALVAIAPQSVAQTIYKSDVEDESWEFYYNIATHSRRALKYEPLEEWPEPCTRIRITIYSFDLKSIWKQFTLVAPNGYVFRDYQPTYICGYDEVGFPIHVTDDLFNRDNLAEVIMYIREQNGDYDSSKMVLMNENSQVLLEFPEDADTEDFLVSTNSGGYLYMVSEDDKKFYVIDTNASSGVNSVMANEHPGSVSPNPSNGAATVTIDWGYTLLNAGTMTVVDMEGKLVHSQAIGEGKSRIDLKTSRLAPGTYIYVVQSDNGYTTTGKLIIN